ncbi:TVP38/TMEM64 family protein [Halopiger goleimassiliensis]|uniref:TVP38/TMEM64 family protein n=1 Tax=Halopiger goleimassiliensis TaxID=1293048 RepID=UPI0006778E67|nr:VTT domain-containing protein [Halopiger goleimassiliensis]
MSTPSTRALVGLALVSSILVAGLLVSPSAVIGTLETLSADPVVFGAVVAALYLVRPLLAWPTTPLAIVAGYGFGVAMGVPIALLGVLVTVTPVFLVARRVMDPGRGSTGPLSSSGSLGGVIDRAARVTKRYYRTAGPLRGVIASRLAPIPSDVATCAAAASGVQLRYFLAGTAIGELPWTIAAVVVGSSAATITTGGLGDLGLELSVVCGLAAAALLAGPVYRALQTRVNARDGKRSLDS